MNVLNLNEHEDWLLANKVIVGVSIVCGVCLFWDFTAFTCLIFGTPGPIAAVSHDIGLITGLPARGVGMGIIGGVWVFLLTVHHEILFGVQGKLMKQLGRFLLVCVTMGGLGILLVLVMFVMVNVRSESTVNLIRVSYDTPFEYKERPTPESLRKMGIRPTRRALVRRARETHRDNWKNRLESETLFFPTFWKIMLVE